MDNNQANFTIDEYERYQIVAPNSKRIDFVVLDVPEDIKVSRVLKLLDERVRRSGVFKNVFTIDFEDLNMLYRKFL